MTVEIAIMNKYGVALAADSAVTINGRKVINTASKLFKVFDEIGIMVYGSADFLGVPWETIIGMFKKEYANVEFSTLEACKNRLLKFIQLELSN